MNKLRDELAALARRTGAVEALVIDAKSPIVWGSTTAEHVEHHDDDADERDLLEWLLAQGGTHGPDPELERLSRTTGLPVVDVLGPDPEVLALVPKAICAKYRLLPLARGESRLVVALSDPRRAAGIYDVALVTGLAVTPVIARGGNIVALLESAYTSDKRDYETAIRVDAKNQDHAAAEMARWTRHMAAAEAISLVRELPKLDSLHKGGRVNLVHSEQDFSAVAQSFASIYVLVLAFTGPIDEPLVRHAVTNALPAIERLVLALPPSPGPSTTEGAKALRRR